MARDEAGPGSDVDLLVEFGRPITLFDLVAARSTWSVAWAWRRVDLVAHSDSLYPAFRNDILGEAVHVG